MTLQDLKDKIEELEQSGENLTELPIHSGGISETREVEYIEITIHDYIGHLYSIIEIQ